MEQQDLLNALKGKRLHWRDEDNENDGVIEYITTTTKEDEYILLFDNLPHRQVIIDRLHIKELAIEGHTCDKRYTYCLDESPIEYIRKALVGKRLRWANDITYFVNKIESVEESKKYDGVALHLEGDDEFLLDYPIVHELIAKGSASDDYFVYSLPDDETPATSTTGDIVYSDGIDWEGRTWDVFKHLYLVDEIDTETALENARGMVEIYRKATEGKV